jgi:SPP1 gp7 family putative phage head morphogenesis protein
MAKLPTRQELQAARRAARERFAKVRYAERQYSMHLGSVGRNIGSIVRGFAAKGRIFDRSALEEALLGYSNLLRPWAQAVAERMIADVSARDLSAWKHFTGEIGRSLFRELKEAPTGYAHQKILDEQVHLISSLPLDAAKRVHVLTREALVSGRRAEEIAKDIEQLGNVSVSKARQIARGEVGRTATAFVQVRAQSIGSDGFKWRGTLDSVERPEHVKLEGTFHPWNNPPVAGKGKGGVPVRYLPGAGGGCRCWPEPQIPDL